MTDIFKSGAELADKQRERQQSVVPLAYENPRTPAMRQIHALNAQLPQLGALLISRSMPKTAIEKPVFARFGWGGPKEQKGSKPFTEGWLIYSKKVEEAGQVSSRSWSEGSVYKNALFLLPNLYVAEVYSERYFARYYEAQDLPPSFEYPDRKQPSHDQQPMGIVPGLEGRAQAFADAYQEQLTKLVAKALNS